MWFFSAKQADHQGKPDNAAWLSVEGALNRGCGVPLNCHGLEVRTIQLNQMWSEIKRRFKVHGHELW